MKAALICIALLSFYSFVGGFGILPTFLSSAQSSTQNQAASASWHATTNYPLTSNDSPGIEAQSCVSYSGYIYCVGGTGNNFNPVPDTYFARMNARESTHWKSTTPYPKLSSGYNGTVGESCVESSGYIFCIGGYDVNYNLVGDAFYAPLSKSGIGTWVSTQSYPLAEEAMSCAISFGYIYCVGGYLGGNTFSSAAYYATISSSGIGTWQSTTSYPTLSTGFSGVAGQSCVSFQGYIYCIGGEDNMRNSVADVYYASVGSAGIGSWQSSTAYPLAALPGSCVLWSGSVYCVTGFTGTVDTNLVYRAPLMSTGVGTWHHMPAYPKHVDSESCAVYGGLLYCVGGVDYQAGKVISNVFYLGI